MSSNHFARVSPTGEIDGNDLQLRRSASGSNRSSFITLRRSHDEGDVKPELLVASQDSSQQIWASSGSGNCSSLAPSSYSRSCEEEQQSTASVPRTAWAGHGHKQDFPETEDEELGGAYYSGSTSNKDVLPTSLPPSSVDTTRRTENSSNNYEHRDDADDEEGEEVDVQKAVLYQNRIPIVSATEMNDIDFWSLDGSDDGHPLGCCRRRRRLLLLMAAVAACSVGVWLCIEYLTEEPSYMAPPGNTNHENSQDGSSSHDKKDHLGIDIPTFPTFAPATAKPSGAVTAPPTEPSTNVSTIAPTTEMTSMEPETNATGSVTNSSTIADYNDVQIPNATESPTDFATVPTLLIPPSDDNITFFSFETENPTASPSFRETMGDTTLSTESSIDAAKEVSTDAVTDTVTDPANDIPATSEPTMAPPMPTSFPTISPTFASLPVIIGHDTTNMTVFVEENHGGSNSTNSTTSITIENSTSTVPPTTILVNGRETELEKPQNETHGTP